SLQYPINGEGSPSRPRSLLPSGREQQQQQRTDRIRGCSSLAALPGDLYGDASDGACAPCSGRPCSSCSRRQQPRRPIPRRASLLPAGDGATQCTRFRPSCIPAADEPRLSQVRARSEYGYSSSPARLPTVHLRSLPSESDAASSADVSSECGRRPPPPRGAAYGSHRQRAADAAHLRLLSRYDGEGDGSLLSHVPHLPRHLHLPLRPALPLLHSLHGAPSLRPVPPYRISRLQYPGAIDD
ncbi:hypothetical protein PMAYCL1PPCAC_08111, partial [Pristionchus mayeri]